MNSEWDILVNQFLKKHSMNVNKTHSLELNHEYL